MPRYISLGELLTQWWKLPYDTFLVEVYRLDFDELMAILKIECPDAHGLNVQVANVEINRQGLVFVTFSAGESPDATH